MPIGIAADFPALLTRLAGEGAQVIATSAKASHLAYDATLGVRPLVMVMGNETEGLSEAARDVATDFVALPMAPNGASSLNVTVAAGVLLYEAVRQNRE